MGLHHLIEMTFLVLFVCTNIVAGEVDEKTSGKNVIPNFSFEEGSTDWPFFWESKIDSGKCIVKLEEEGSDGKRCISIESPDNESSGRWESEYFPVEPGRDYLFSVKAKVRLQDENKRAYFHITSKEDIDVSHVQPVYITDTSWNVFRGKVITIPAGVNAIQCRFRLLKNMEGQKVWIDEVKLTPLPRMNIKEESPVFSDSFNDITRWQVLVGQREYCNIIEDNGNKALEYNDPTLGIIETEWIGKKSEDVRIKLRIKVLEPVLLDTNPATFGIWMIMEEYSRGGGMDAYNFILNSLRDHIATIDLYKSERYLTSGYPSQALGRNLEFNQWHEIVFQKTGGLIKILVDEVPVVAWYDFVPAENPVNKVRLRFWKAQGIYRIDEVIIVPLKSIAGDTQ